MKKPLIGITPLKEREKKDPWMLPDYPEAIRAAGGIPVILPLKTGEEHIRRICKSCDGLLFTGGQDVDPSIYHAERMDYCGPACPERDEMETLLFQEAFQNDLPILGICRGHQLINAVMGGTLYQDLKEEFPVAQDHNLKKSHDDRIAHSVCLVQDSPLARLLGKDTLNVNSRHHQAVRSAAPGLNVMAWAADGVNEACWCPGRRFLWTVQWHPEQLFRKEPAQLSIFRAFVKNCAGVDR